MNDSRRRVLSAMLAATFAFAPALQPVTVAAVYSNGTATAQFNVTLTIQANCAIAANPLAFGTSGVLTSALNQQTTVSVTCSNSTPYNIGLDAGSVSGSTVASRLMGGTTSGNTGTTVGYQLYQDSSHTTIWGNTQGTDTVGGTGNGSAQILSVYGQVPTQATPKPDTYQATVTATVYF
ncbi:MULTISPECIES: spore coat U domain-containing protein [unclassified Burkholderia]|uniref:Csu type fimbrial protein n=1 Tax=unclassified Burkholderia TaxID=2613784 RepID=UPI000F5742DF|nr:MULTISPECIES: spore coat U domain-containing protein [unclassified Burkholderia]RQR37723.1 spore coat U domain-containing protein [Burkholderia sp. Bp9131]RQR68430.1 spore coat U domain-containing protein [Burkholderia sp. Bp9015]RQR91853.1 spore coat U domain-containing protein [Burkholderia sp. Bp8994]RQS29106.1 spore coat U domain-containing protein [Burkholderia sp. Bp8995]RQS38531.1 spore coat U domain-containing protein [Burkholderia sp. Bp8990]